jgi:N-acetylneuraminic acid mutarotase
LGEAAPAPPFRETNHSRGVTGAFMGMHQNALIIAGGANFNLLYRKDNKKWYDDIWILNKDSENYYRWIYGGKLDHPLAFGASVSTDHGLICIGGNDAERSYADVCAPRAQAKPSFDLWCYTRDESRPLEADVQA